MLKKGQVTVFVIVGIIVITIFMLLYVYSKDLAKISMGTKNTQTRVSEVFDAIQKDQIEKCINSETKKAVQLFLDNGGTFEMSNYVTYHTKKVNVLCQAIPGKTQCMQNPLFLNVVSEKFAQKLKKKIFDCIDLSVYKKSDMIIETGNLNVSVEIGKKNLVVHVNYPLTVSAGIVNFSRSDFVYNVNVPLGEIIKITNDVLKYEARNGGLDIIMYTVDNAFKYVIQLKWQYPNKIYFVGLRDSNYKLNFAVVVNQR